MSAADRSVRRWLIWSAAAVALAVAVGGITRLTESGLSITEWRPVSGVLPPLSGAEWDAAYQRYLQIPEAQTVHRGITLGQFQSEAEETTPAQIVFRKTQGATISECRPTGNEVFLRLEEPCDRIMAIGNDFSRMETPLSFETDKLKAAVYEAGNRKD